MLINLLIKLLLFYFILFYSFYSYYILINLKKIDIVICNVNQYVDMGWEYEHDVAYCKYYVWANRHYLRYQ